MNLEALRGALLSASQEICAAGNLAAVTTQVDGQILVVFKLPRQVCAASAGQARKPRPSLFNTRPDIAEWICKNQAIYSLDQLSEEVKKRFSITKGASRSAISLWLKRERDGGRFK